AVEAGDGDAAAERRGGEADRRAREQRRPLAFEQPVPRDVEEDVEVARRRAARTRLALARQADARPFVDPGGDVDGQRLAPVDAALAMALVARIGDDLARSLAMRAGALDHEEALLRAHLAVAAARRAAMGRGAGP